MASEVEVICQANHRIKREGAATKKDGATPTDTERVRLRALDEHAETLRFRGESPECQPMSSGKSE